MESTMDMNIISYLPDDVLLEIFKRVEPVELIKNCLSVCWQWNKLIASRTLWLDIFKIKFHKPLLNTNVTINALQQICTSNALGRNLIKNGQAENKYKHWKITLNGGDKFRIEKEGDGCQKLSDLNVDQMKKCWVTSYGFCSKTQTIDLTSNGIFIDEVQPRITASEWTTARFDCGSIYRLKVSLLDEKKKILSEKETERKIAQWGDSNWCEVKLEFKDYGPARYIQFEHGGQDTQFWAGWFGPKFTGASIILDI